MSDRLIESQKALDEIKSYDLGRIPRREELGQAFHFEDAVAPSVKLKEFFSRIPAETLPDISENFIGAVQSHALAFLNVLGQIQSFNPQSEDNPNTARDNILNSLRGMYETVFNNLHPVVAFVAARQRDFSSLELEARAAKDSAILQAGELSAAMNANQQEADRILGEIRKVAAEQGVSQQAYHFKEEADEHDRLAKAWERYTVKVAVGLGIYSLLTAAFAVLFVPENAQQAVQLGLSKVLIFAVIAYMLFHCARTTAAHRHNAVVNHHRENALLTYNALVAAAGEEQQSDIVLTHAASCIFAPQDTGYTKQAAHQGSGVQVIEALPRIARATGVG